MPKGLMSTLVACYPPCIPLSRSMLPYLPSHLVSLFPSSNHKERGGPREGNLQISSINHRPETNVTNILQLGKTAVGSEPSISSPHDPLFTVSSTQSFTAATNIQINTHTKVYVPILVK